MRTIFDVTSTILSQTGKFEFDFSFSGHRWSLTPEQGARFVTKIKWFFPFDPYCTENVSLEIDIDISVIYRSKMTSLKEYYYQH